MCIQPEVWLYVLSTIGLTGCMCFEPCAFNQRFDWLYMLSTRGLTGYVIILLSCTVKILKKLESFSDKQ